MRLNELEKASEPTEPLSDEKSEIVLTQFRDDDPNIDPHLRELSKQLVGLSAQVRMVLSLYLPQFDWGGSEV